MTGMLKPSLAQMDMAYDMFKFWTESAKDEVRGLWYRTNLSFWIKDGTPMATVRWAPFDLDVASFAIPDTLPQDDDIDSWPVDQALWWTEGPEQLKTIVYAKHQTEGDRVSVPEAVDQFLQGVWTPPWCCTACRKRYNKNIKPA